MQLMALLSAHSLPTYTDSTPLRHFSAIPGHGTIPVILDHPLQLVVGQTLSNAFGSLFFAIFFTKSLAVGGNSTSLCAKTKRMTLSHLFLVSKKEYPVCPTVRAILDPSRHSGNVQGVEVVDRLDALLRTSF